jgi:histone-lysine N-methyltransferase SETMAR
MYWTAQEHPPYSPDLSPCDYHMFGPLKEALRPQRFDDDGHVENFTCKWPQTRPPSFYNSGIKKFPIRLQKCIEKGGNCRKVRIFFIL